MSEIFQQLDTKQLFAIAWRICSEETVGEAQEFAGLVQQAAQLVTKSGLRIMGVSERALNDPDEKNVRQIIDEYSAVED